MGRRVFHLFLPVFVSYVCHFVHPWPLSVIDSDSVLKVCWITAAYLQPITARAFDL